MKNIQKNVFLKGLVRFVELLNQTAFPVIVDSGYPINSARLFKMKSYVAALDLSRA